MIKNAFILNFLKLYNMLWQLCIPFLKRNQRLKSGFNKRINPDHHSLQDIWIQAASAGEAYLAVKIIKGLTPEKTTRIIVTSTTQQGIDILKTGLSREQINPLIELTIDWFLFDKPTVIEKAVKIINPSVMVLLETELWPALLYYLKSHQTKILIANARLSQKSFKNYMRTKFLWKHLAPDIILATSELDRNRYAKVFQHSKVSIMKNIKFECIAQDELADPVQEQIKQLLNHDLDFTILASVRKEEEQDILSLIGLLLDGFPDQTIGLFPRHMHRIDAFIKEFESKSIVYHLRSELSSPVKEPGIILWDVFGELKSAYGLASVVFVGGSLKPLGGQNFLEPSVQGAPTITGPYYDDFAWAGEQIFNKKIVIKEKEYYSVAETMLKILNNPGSYPDQKERALQYIKTNLGGTSQVCLEILSALYNRS